MDVESESIAVIFTARISRNGPPFVSRDGPDVVYETFLIFLRRSRNNV